MKPAPEAGLPILEFLVRHMKEAGIRVGDPLSYVGYKEVHDALGWKVVEGLNAGESLKRLGLEELAVSTKEEEHPAITGLIINKTKRRPGNGYYTLFGKEPSDSQLWHREMRKSEKYRWERFLGFGTPDPPSETPVAADFDEPLPERVKSIRYRILRDTELARRVKELHRNICQICKVPVKLHNGSSYAEGHHIKPLGGSDPGPDTQGNIICVCPNCHALCDLGAIPLDAAKLSSDLHEVSPVYVAFHNERIFKGRG